MQYGPVHVKNNFVPTNGLQATVVEDKPGVVIGRADKVCKLEYYSFLNIQIDVLFSGRALSSLRSIYPLEMLLVQHIKLFRTASYEQ